MRREALRYVWQAERWPRLTWSSDRLIQLLGQCRFRQGKLLNQVASLGVDLGRQAYAAVLVEEAVKTASIEGEALSRPSVRSSVARRLGLATAGLPLPERHVDGLVEVLLDATEHFDSPLTEERLKGWQAALFPTGYSGMRRIIVGDWRGAGPMRVVSGPVGRQRVHYEAPPANRIPDEIGKFLRWWEDSLHTLDGLVRAGMAHFRFVTIHPFEDGNGRIARAITDMALAQDEKVRKRFYSMSAQIEQERAAYYDILEKTQKGAGDITDWLEWFLGCFQHAVRNSDKIRQEVLVKAGFWKQHARTPINERQRKAINRLLDAGRGGFAGGLSTRKYTSMVKVSRATAYREITDLVAKGMLRISDAKGRSTSYDLIWPGKTMAAPPLP